MRISLGTTTVCSDLVQVTVDYILDYHPEKKITRANIIEQLKVELFWRGRAWFDNYTFINPAVSEHYGRRLFPELY